VHLQKQVECGPCQLRTCPLDHRCMTLLTPQEVLGAVQELLARPARRQPVPLTVSLPSRIERKAS
jgi:heptosyltransferase-2